MERPWDDVRVINPGFGKARFSKTEIRDISIAVFVLSFAFFLILRRGSHLHSDPVINALGLFGVAFALVVTSFMLHELAHKIVAQRYGAWAEFRMYIQGLVMALVFSFFGFLFAAPGAVYINGRIDEKTNGKISASGPMVNLIIGIIALTVWFLSSGLVKEILWLFAWINGFLALFNMLPVPPLDGSKIYRWNAAVYIGMMITAGAILAILLIQP